jgi:enamine deaminase RidA (YjgF/YER057c/UK114 family)
VDEPGFRCLVSNRNREGPMSGSRRRSRSTKAKVAAEKAERSRAATPEARVRALNLQLPPAPQPVGVYQSLLVTGKFAYVSGHGPVQSDGSLMTGRVGADLDRMAGKVAARQAGLTILSTLRRVLGSLDKVERVIKILGFVNCTADFTEQPLVINGCSELFADIWGPHRGVGARSAVGANSLPSNITVEIEAIVLLK